ncbi:MAG TPA: methionine adenosyltransferase, partial [Thermoleophilia bacterium]|nr:methionine adenosyltransferase [Thermoleophilia bacterium]
MDANNFLFTSESVTEGHPDKLADQISDAILDAIIAEDPFSRVACETLVNTGFALVAGEISTETYVDIPKIVRETVKDVGYTEARFGFDYETCGVMVAVDEQSPDISQGVSQSLEVRTDADDEDSLDLQGAGDQGMMFGFACNETRELMPLPISLAHQLARRLADVRKAGMLPYLRPDGKSQVSVRYENGRPVEIVKVVLAAQHSDTADVESVIRPDLIEHVVEPILPKHLYDPTSLDQLVVVNATGKFVVGGPMGDAGLTGRKVIVDTYGGAARHGGGCFSGKDPSKVDRSGAYAARYVAKNVVAAGLADRCELQVAYAIGVAHPVSLMVDCQGTEKVDLATIEKLIREHFDLRPAAIIRDLDLRRP